MSAMFQAEAPTSVEATASLGLRFAAIFIDAVIAIPLQILALIPFVGLLFAPLLCLYWLSRDSFFGGQSVGKKLVGIRVVGPNGGKISWTQSAQRNIVYFSLLIEIVPMIGAVGTVVAALAFFADAVLIVATGQRIGDRISGTRVVKA